MIDLGRHDILGVRISAVDYDAAVARIVSAAETDQPLGVSALAVHGVMTGAKDPIHRQRLNALDMLVPDGQPVRWALRWLHRISLPDRVYGPNLMLRTLEAAAEGGLPVFLYGSTPATLEPLVHNLQTRFPALVIAGYTPSRFRRLTPDEKDDVIREIRESGAKVVFVGLGCPRQEVWTYEYRDHLRMPVLAVGAAFDFHAGVLPQAPKKMQNLGLEWLFRLTKEPARLWKRYVLLNPEYLARILLQRLGKAEADTLDADIPAESFG